MIFNVRENKKLKKSLVIVMCSLVLMGVTGCKRAASVSIIGGADGPTSIFLASSSDKPEETAEDTSEYSSTEEVTEVAEEANNNEDWRSAYLDYLSTDDDMDACRESDIGFKFSLIYLDDDDIPELFIDTDVEAGGQIVATYHDGKVVEQHLSRLGSQYIEKSGLIYTNTGHMDYYPLTITKLENGTFTEIGEGLSYLSEEDREKLANDNEYPYTLTYEWEGETVSEEQFNAKVAELYDLDKSKYPDDMHNYDEIVEILSED